MTLGKHLGPSLLVAALSLTSCKSTILHKDGMREAVTQPLINTIEKESDKLKLDKLVEKIGDLVDSTKKTTELSNKLIEDTQALTPKINRIADNVGEITTNLSDAIKELRAELKGQAKESLIWRILPPAVICIALILAVFIVVNALRRHNVSKS